MLRVRYVNHLVEVVEPVAEWLNADRAGGGLFDPDHLIVPTKGAKAWLIPELAKQVGSRDGLEDGVIANVRVGYVGSLNRFVSPSRYEGVDPWSIEAMTGFILELIVGDSRFGRVVEQSGGVLQAARRLADRFDRYHARRPTMIRSWERGVPVLAPSTSDVFSDGEWVPADLGDHRWQFDLWSELRARIGVESWPMQVESMVARMRNGENPVGLPPRLMVAGLQSLSPSAIELLDAFGSVSDVEVLLVHPSSGLAAEWARAASGVQVTPGVFPLRLTDEPTGGDVHPLLHSWLRGSREMQHMLASQGVEVRPHAHTDNDQSTTLLERLRAAVGRPFDASPQTVVPEDHSVQIHRCYSLSRQVGALHDALLQAFVEIPDLAPHEVVILSPRIEDAAPFLEAVFDRETMVETANGTSTVRIPLAVADRGLRQVSEGAEFLASLLELMTSRFGVESFLSVAASPIVRGHLGVGDDDLDVWMRQIDRARVRWGLSQEQRTAAGLVPEVESAHTWQLAIERSLLGAALPDAAPHTELGGVVPLDDVGIDDLDALSSLALIYRVVSQLEELARAGAARSIAEWRSALESVIVDLCGEGDGAADAFDALANLGALTSVTSADGSIEELDTPVSFADLAGYLLDTLSGTPGYLPLRTGAVTATSLIPLRGVPYRVVCLLGMDDGVSSAREPESDDLISLQTFAGDDDSRLELRRQMLDAMMSASERFIVTCDGRNILNNKPVPLITPLAEFADFCAANGVGKRPDGSLHIEYFHTRHATSPRNFELGKENANDPEKKQGIMPGVVWSHAIATKELAGKVGEEKTSATSLFERVERDGDPIVDIKDLEQFVKSPLDVFTKHVLRVNTWIEDQSAEEATLPLDVDDHTRRRYIEGYIAGRSGMIPGWTPEQHRDIARLNGDLPVGKYADEVVDEMDQLATDIVKKCKAFLGTATSPEGVPIMVKLNKGRVVAGTLNGLHSPLRRLSLVRAVKWYKSDLKVLALRLLVARSALYDVGLAIPIHQHEKKEKKTEAIARLVYLDEAITPDVAREMLSEIISLRAWAGTRPFPSFGSTVDQLFNDPKHPDFEAARKAFETYVTSKSDYGGRSRGYTSSVEYRIYGELPNFDEIFDISGKVFDFWRRFHSVFHMTRVKLEVAEVKLPSAQSHWMIVKWHNDPTP